MDTITIEDLFPLSETEIVLHLINWIKDYSPMINSRQIDTQKFIPPSIYLSFGRVGLFAIHVSRQYGGLALSVDSILKILQVLGYIDISLCLVVIDGCLVAHTMQRFARDDVKGYYLPLMARGLVIGAPAITEPAAGSNPRGMMMRARMREDGKWVLNGEKWWIGSAEWSNFFTVFCQAYDVNGEFLGMAGFVVERGVEGFVVGDVLDGMGINGFPKNHIYFNDVVVSPNLVLGEIGKGMEVAQDTMMFIRLCLSTVAVGAMKNCLNRMHDYASKRFIATGRLLSNPVSLVRLTELVCAIQSFDILIDTTSSFFAKDPALCEETFIVCKTLTSEYLGWTADMQIQMLGARGYDENNLAPLMYRDARPFRIFEGPTETLQMYIGTKFTSDPRELKQFFQKLSQIELFNRLELDIKSIKHRLKDDPTFHDPNVLNYWYYYLAGDIISYALLLACVAYENQLNPQENTLNALDWCSSKLDESFLRCMRKSSAENSIFTEEKLSVLVSDLTFGDIHFKSVINVNETTKTIIQEVEQESVPVSLNDILFQNEVNQTKKKFPKRKCIHELFEIQAELNPENIAISFEDTSLTYYQLDRISTQLAIHLQMNFSIIPDTMIAMCFPRGLEMMIAVLAILKSGGAYVPIDPKYPESRILYILENSGTNLILSTDVIIDSGIFSGFDGSTIPVNDSLENLSLANTLKRDVTPKNLCYMIYTSGSTGNPKGVMISHRSLVNFSHHSKDLYCISPGTKVLQFASLSFDAAAEEIYPTLISGATLVIRTESMINSIVNFFDKINEWCINIIDLPTAFWHQIVEEMDQDLVFPECIYTIIIGGERALPEKVKKWLNIMGTYPSLYNTYGPTEATIVATYCNLTTYQNSDHSEYPIGIPLSNSKIYVVDDNLQRVPVGAPGELLISGEGVSNGYLNQPEKNAASFVPNPFDQYPVLYRTGDIVIMRRDGNIEFVGRKDFQVKIRGFRIELSEIETVLNRHPSVKESIVVSKSVKGNQSLIAYYISSDKNILDNLKYYLKQELPDYMVPHVFISVESFPTNVNGKIDRKMLPEPTIDISLSHAPTTEIEIQVHSIWCNVLGLPSISINEQFLDLGGQSLSAIQITSKIRKKLKIETTIQDLFKNSTISEFCRFLSSFSEEAWDYNIPKTSEEIYYPTSSQLNFFNYCNMFPDKPVFNESISIRMRETIDRNKLEQAISILLLTHDGIRLTISLLEDYLLQQLEMGDFDFNLEYDDVSNFDDPKIRAEELGKHDLLIPMDFSKLLLRFRLVKIAESDFILYCVLHHVVIDGISVYMILLPDLYAIYHSLCNAGEPLPFSKPNITYLDYSEWMRKLLGTDKLNKRRDFWRAELLNFKCLWTDPLLKYPEEEFELLSGGRITTRVGPELTDSLKSCSKRRGVTLFSTLATMVNILISQYNSKQKDIILGITVSGRFPEVEHIAGNFIEILPLRTKLSTDLTVLSYNTTIHEKLLEIQSNLIPLNEILSFHKNPGGILSVIMVLEPPIPDNYLDGWEVSRSLHSDTTKFDLFFEVEEHHNELLIHTEYDLTRFSHVNANNMEQYMLSILNNICTDHTKVENLNPIPFHHHTELN